MRHHPLPSVLMGVTLAVAGISLLGHLLDLPTLYTWGPSIGMAPNTCVALIALATGGLCHLVDHAPPYDTRHEDD